MLYKKFGSLFFFFCVRLRNIFVFQGEFQKNTCKREKVYGFSPHEQKKAEEFEEKKRQKSEEERKMKNKIFLPKNSIIIITNFSPYSFLSLLSWGCCCSKKWQEEERRRRR